MTKLVFFGTSEFAVPALTKLTETNFEIERVITRPDKPAGRNQELSPSPVKQAASGLGLEVLQPKSLLSTDYLPRPVSLRRAEADGKAGGLLSMDLYVVASYGKIIPKEILDIPKYGALNIHPSLLPKYRGPSPIHAAILNGDKETGVSIIKMDEEMDHGNIIAKSKMRIANSKIYYQELHDKLAELGADLLIKTLPGYVSGQIKPKPQNHDKATYTELIDKDNARINWEHPAEVIERQVRAYHKWPVAWTTLDGKRLKIFRAEAVAAEYDEGPGSIIPSDSAFKVKCGEGILDIKTLQPEGKAVMSAEEFVRGYEVEGKVLK